MQARTQLPTKALKFVECEKGSAGDRHSQPGPMHMIDRRLFHVVDPKMLFDGQIIT